MRLYYFFLLFLLCPSAKTMIETPLKVMRDVRYDEDIVRKLISSEFPDIPLCEDALKQTSKIYFKYLRAIIDKNTLALQIPASDRHLFLSLYYLSVHVRTACGAIPLFVVSEPDMDEILQYHYTFVLFLINFQFEEDFVAFQDARLLKRLRASAGNPSLFHSFKISLIGLMKILEALYEIRELQNAYHLLYDVAPQPNAYRVAEIPFLYGYFKKHSMEALLLECDEVKDYLVYYFKVKFCDKIMKNLVKLRISGNLSHELLTRHEAYVRECVTLKLKSQYGPIPSAGITLEDGWSKFINKIVSKAVIVVMKAPKPHPAFLQKIWRTFYEMIKKLFKNTYIIFHNRRFPAALETILHAWCSIGISFSDFEIKELYSIYTRFQLISSRPEIFNPTESLIRKSWYESQFTFRAELTNTLMEDFVQTLYTRIFSSFYKDKEEISKLATMAFNESVHVEIPQSDTKFSNAYLNTASSLLMRFHVGYISSICNPLVDEKMHTVFEKIRKIKTRKIFLYDMGTNLGSTNIHKLTSKLVTDLLSVFYKTCNEYLMLCPPEVVIGDESYENLYCLAMIFVKSAQIEKYHDFYSILKFHQSSAVTLRIEADSKEKMDHFAVDIEVLRGIYECLQDQRILIAESVTLKKPPSETQSKKFKPMGSFIAESSTMRAPCNTKRTRKTLGEIECEKKDPCIYKEHLLKLFSLFDILPGYITDEDLSRCKEEYIREIFINIRDI